MSAFQGLACFFLLAIFYHIFVAKEHIIQKRVPGNRNCTARIIADFFEFDGIREGIPDYGAKIFGIVGAQETVFPVGYNLGGTAVLYYDRGRAHGCGFPDDHRRIVVNRGKYEERGTRHTVPSSRRRIGDMAGEYGVFTQAEVDCFFPDFLFIRGPALRGQA